MRSSGMEEKGRWDHCLIHWFWIGLNPSCQLLLDQTKIDSVWLSPDGLRTAESWRRCRRTETSGRVCVRFEWLLLYGIACVRGLMHEKGLLYQPWLIWIALRTKILALQKGGGLHLARIFLGELAMFSMQVAGQFGEAYWDSLDAIFHLSRLIVHSARAFMTMLFPLAIAGNLLMPSYSNLF